MSQCSVHHASAKISLPLLHSCTPNIFDLTTRRLTAYSTPAYALYPCVFAGACNLQGGRAGQSAHRRRRGKLFKFTFFFLSHHFLDTRPRTSPNAVSAYEYMRSTFSARIPHALMNIVIIVCLQLKRARTLTNVHRDVCFISSPMK